MRLSLLLFTVAATLAAQDLKPRFSFGVTGGVPLGDMMPSRSGFFHEESRRYTLGPAFDLSLNSKLSVTVNPLYKRTGYSTLPFSGFIDLGPDVPFQYMYGPERMRAHSLELPVIGKYHFGNNESRFRPFVGAGFAFQTAWYTTERSFTTRDVQTGALSFSDTKTERRTSTDTGVVLSTGFEFAHGPLRFTPELRYTRWGSASPTRDRQQTDALLTIRFGNRRN